MIQHIGGGDSLALAFRGARAPAPWPLRGLLLLASAVVLALLFGTARAQTKPNFVFVMADDMTPDELRHMPRTMQYMGANGITFENAMVSNSLCCPSRVSTLTGRYSHNTGVHSNEPPNGGFAVAYNSGLESSTLATWLKSGGYTTAYIGKYLNGYGNPRTAPATYVPPGWDQWHALSSGISYFNYELNENGVIVSYGSDEASYSTDVFSRKAGTALNGMLAGGRPFFMMVSPFAPHTNTGAEDDESGLMAVPAPRHRDLLQGLAAPRSASFNEADVSDKAAHIRPLPLLTSSDVEWIDLSYRARAQSLIALDELVASIILKLQAHPAGQNTYIVFTSDNGYYFGDHRIKSGKGRLFEAASRVPLLIAGPDVVKGLHRREMVANIDLAPTLARLANIRTPTNIDGRTLDALLRTNARSVSWLRRSMLLSWLTRARGLRLGTYAYYETVTGSTPFVELYDLMIDPDQTSNIAARLAPESATALASALAQLGQCSAASCRSLENKFGDALVKLLP